MWKHTHQDWCFALWLRERIRVSYPRVNDQSSVNSGSEPWTMSMPPKCSFLALDCKPVSVTLPWSNWTLCNKFRSIRPRCPHLSDTMPRHPNQKKKVTYFRILCLHNVAKNQTLKIIWCPRLHLPVNGDIVASFVSNLDLQSVTVIYLQGWSWKLPIDCNGIVGFAQPLHFGCLDLFYIKIKTVNK